MTAVLTEMRSRASTMSANHRRLAQFIDANYDAVAFSTITQLAELSGVSEATVVRFCKALDYPGYPALQKEIRRLVRADLKGTERFRLGARGGSPLQAVIEKEQENIAALQAGFDSDAFRAALGLLRDASEIVVTGSRSTAALANHFWFGLQKMGLRASAMLAISSECYDRLSGVSDGGLLVLISYPRYPREHVELLAFGRERGLGTLVLTDSPFSPMRGDVTLHAPAESASFTAFHCAPMILINAVLLELSLLDPDATLAALNRFEAVAARQRMFAKPKNGRPHGR